MTKDFSLNAFVKKYDLYDKGIDSIRIVDDLVEFTFSLFHCDDPERDD